MKEKLLLFEPTSERMPTLSLGYIASYLRENLNFDNISIETKKSNQLEVIKKHKPDVVGFTTYTLFYNKTVELARRVKEDLDIPTIIGGHHISAIPNTLPPEFDIGVVGEGEQTIAELMDLFLNENEFNANKLKEINGIAYHSGGRINITPNRELIKPLDAIPFPARDLLDMEKYLQTSGRGESYSKPDQLAPIITARGCPYRCVFCSSSHFWKTIRFHSPEYVVEEIKFLIDHYGVEIIHISDDLFIANKKRVYKIVKLIEKEKINEKVKFWVNVRANLLNSEICELLKRMNSFHVMMGLESGSDRILGFLKKNTVTVQQNQKAIALAKRYGFRVEGSFMLGVPGETRKDMMKTYDFIKKSPIDSFGLHITTPLPGTELWELAKEQGKVSDDMDFDNLSLDPLFSEDLERFVVLTDEVTKKELFEIYFKFQRLVAKRGRYVKVSFSDVLSPHFWKIIISDPTKALKYAKLKFSSLLPESSKK